MKFPWKIILSGVALTGVVILNYAFKPATHESEEHGVHYHAGFRVYRDDQLQDYSGYQYMNYTPCSEHDKKKSAAAEQIEKAHLHDGVGDVVHVHREGAVWGDLFKNIKAELPDNETVVGYIDGQRVEEIKTEPIEPYTTAVILIGMSEASRSGERVAKDHIEEVERKSELCGS